MYSNERRGLSRCRCSALNSTFVLSTERLEEHCERNVMKNGSLEGTEKDCKKSSPEQDKVPEITKSKQVWLPAADLRKNGTVNSQAAQTEEERRALPLMVGLCYR